MRSSDEALPNPSTLYWLLGDLENATGSPGADDIVGTDAANTLSGGSGSDEIAGGAGGDAITDGSGRDALTGGSGSDRFVYSAAQSVVGVSRDTITDFVSRTRLICLALARSAGSVHRNSAVPRTNSDSMAAL